MKHTKLVVTSVTLVMLMAITAGCVETDTVTDTFDGLYATTEDTVLTVKNMNGDITVTRYNGDEVDLHVLKVSEVSQDRLDQMTIDVTEEAGNIDIETKFSGSRETPSAQMTIKVPNGVHVRTLETSNGDIIATIDGRDGPVNAGSSNGRVDVTVVNDMNFEVSLSTSNGEIQATIEGDVNADLTIATSNNGVDLTVEADLNANITAGSSNGDIVMRIGHDQNANFTTTTTNGAVTFHEFTITFTVNEQTNKVGTLGTGGNLVTLDTDNGDIDVWKVV
jgi:hypothetical protein